MERVILRYKDAKRAEAKAREQAESRARAREQLVQVANHPVPPPETELLGRWRVVETIRLQTAPTTRHTSGLDEVIELDVLLPDGTLLGRWTQVLPKFTDGANVGKRLPYTALIGDVQGKVAKPGEFRAVTLPRWGPFRMGTRAYLPIAGFVKATWAGYEMRFETRNDKGDQHQGRAVRLDDE
jgi:hypothetical protein